MKKVILAVVLVIVSGTAGGCRLFCDDRPSRCYRSESLPVIVSAAPTPVVPPPAHLPD